MEKIFLIDGNHLVHRSFYAIKPLHTRSGIQTNAVFGFFSILLNLIEKENPKYLAVTFDEKAPTFRHKEHDAYKATRTKAPDELYTQIPIIKEILNAFSVPYYSIEGWEADDLLGTFSHQAVAQGVNAMIITGDHDALQLIDEDKILVIFPHKGYREPIIFNKEKVIEKFGITPEQLIDYKGICGDSSDNLKGVKGIGAKGAQALLQKYGTVENIYEHIDEIVGKTQEKLINDKESAITCKRLAKIITDVPMELKMDECVLCEFDAERIQNKLEEYDLFSLQKRLERFFNKKNKVEKELQIPKIEQMQIF